MKINQHILRLKPSATLVINQKVKYLRSQGKKIYHFGFGQSPFPVHDSIQNSLKDSAGNNHYLPTLGLESLREEVAGYLKDYHKVDASKENIFIGPGSKELLYQSILIFEGAFLVPKGSWVSYLPQIKSKNGTYSILETKLKNGFKLEASVLQRYCEEHPEGPKILILNSPNNPTGSVYSAKELKGIAEVCRAYEIIALSDEIYSLLNFSGLGSPSLGSFYPERTLIFSGLSKAFSAGGYRMGFMMLPKEFMHLNTVYRSLFSETFSCVASPVQYAALTAFKMEQPIQRTIEKCSYFLKAIALYVYTSLTKEGIACVKAEGGFYSMVGFENFKKELSKLRVFTSEQLAIYLLEKRNIALLPGSDFYFGDSELYMRLAFVDFDGDKILGLLEKTDTDITDAFIEQYAPNVFYGIKELANFARELSSAVSV